MNLEEWYRAGLVRDYDHGYTWCEARPTLAEVSAFDRGLRDSMKDRPVEVTRFKVLTVEYVDFDEIQRRRALADAYLDENLPWRQCNACAYDFLLDDAIYGKKSGTYLCPKCGVTT